MLAVPLSTYDDRAGSASRRWLLGAAALTLALVFLLLPSGALAQSAATGCDYADPGSGPSAENICWLDFSAYNEATSRLPAGQNMTLSLPGGYTVSFNVFTSGVIYPTAPVGPRYLPTYPDPYGSAIGNGATRPGSYTGIDVPAGLQAWMGNGETVTITLRNIDVRDAAGNPVTGYSLLAADGEVTEYYERIIWTADQPWELLARLQPPSYAPENGCQDTAYGFGTNTVVCSGAIQNTGPQLYGSVLIKADGAKTVSASLSQTAPFPRFGGETTAFAFVTSKVKVTKTVEGRVRPSDSFDVSATSPEGRTIGSETTAGANSATTEELTVLPATAGQSFTLAEAVTPGSGTRLADYSQSWSCTNNGVAIASLSTSGGTSRAVAPEPGELIACTVTNKQLPAEPTIVKTGGADRMVPGKNFTYRLEAKNNGPSRASNIVVADKLPSPLTFVSASPGCANANGTVTCTLASLDPGDPHTFEITVKVPSSVKHCLNNKATVASDTPDSNPDNNASSICVPIKRETNLRITKVASAKQVASGGQVMYTLVVKNDGPSDASGVKVTDPMASGLSLVSAQPSQGSCSTIGGEVSCDVGDVAAGGSAQVLVTATVTAPAGGCGTSSITNTGTVSSDNEDPDPSDNKASASICTEPPPPAKFDLVVAKTVNDKSVYVGQSVKYTVTVTNNGPEAAPDARFTDTLNHPVSVVSVKATQGKCTKSIPMTCQLGNIPVGGKVTITVTVKPRESGCKQRNAASATGAGTDTNPANNMARVDICADPVPLRLTKVADSTSVRAGSTVGYTIRVSNPTVGEAKDVQVCDRLPSGLVYVSSKAKAKFTKGQYCWTIKTLGAHESESFRITVRALGSASGDRTNRATASAPGAVTKRAKDPVRVLGARAAGGGVTG